MALSCEGCSLEFENNHLLQFHISVAHYFHEKYECVSCNESFLHKVDLNSHQCVPDNQKPYHCRYCTKKYMFKSQFHEHLKGHQYSENRLADVRAIHAQHDYASPIHVQKVHFSFLNIQLEREDYLKFWNLHLASVESRDHTDNNENKNKHRSHVQTQAEIDAQIQIKAATEITTETKIEFQPKIEIEDSIVEIVTDT